MEKYGVEEIDHIDHPEIGKLVLSSGYDDQTGRHIAEVMNQSYMQQWVPSTVLENFDSWESIRRWYFLRKAPILLSLLDESQDLVAIAWAEGVRDKKQRDCRQTGVHVYDGYREKGVGEFIGTVLHDILDESKCSGTYYKMQVNDNAAFLLGTKLGYRLDLSAVSDDQSVMKMERGHSHQYHSLVQFIGH